MINLDNNKEKPPQCYFLDFKLFMIIYGLPEWLSGKKSTCNAGDTRDSGLSPGSERYPGGGHSNPLQYSCRENPS